MYPDNRLRSEPDQRGPIVQEERKPSLARQIARHFFDDGLLLSDIHSGHLNRPSIGQVFAGLPRRSDGTTEESRWKRAAKPRQQLQRLDQPRLAQMNPAKIRFAHRAVASIPSGLIHGQRSLVLFMRVQERLAATRGSQHVMCRIE
jgi:hypothetical protein